MPELGEWVLEQACSQARAWGEQRCEPPYVSVNLSIRQLEDPDFIRRFQRALTRSGLRAAAGSRSRSPRASWPPTSGTVRPPLETLRSMGVGVLLDDFGTGYSSLGYVRELPLDGVKLDRIFTRDLTISAGAWTLARSVIALLGQLDLEIIAEGLETAAHLAQLRSLGCHVGQGYLLRAARAGVFPAVRRPWEGLSMKPGGGAPILLLEDERATAALVVQLLAAERITNPVECDRQR